jgi:hypothetical protein
MNQQALEAYIERNADFDLWIPDDTILTCNNTVLLYYQAFLLMP